MSEPSMPSILQTNAVNESQSTQVESVIQEADNHSWIKNRFGKTSFVLAKKGSALATDGMLLWKTIWASYDPSVDSFCSFVRATGGANLIRNCRLYVGGRLVSETREVGQKMCLDNSFIPYDARCEILDEKLSGNEKYYYNTVGLLQLADDKLHSQVGFRVPTATESATVECAVRLDQLFPVLKDTMLPSTLAGDITVELDWVGVWDEIMVESGSGGDGTFTADNRSFEVVRPRLHLDYITFADEVANALTEQINSAEGMTIPYRQQVLVSATLPAVATANTAVRNDIELGFAGRSVMKIYVQKISAVVNRLQLATRSDGLLQESLQLVVNNRNLFDRDVEQVSEMYSYLGQTADKPAYLLSGSYGQVGLLSTVGANQDANTFVDTVKLPALTTATGTAGVRASYQGKSRYLGINLAKTRAGADGINDTPQNAIQVGEAPMVLRLNRNTGAGGSDELIADGASVGSYALNIWVECVKALIIRNGVLDTINM